MDGLSVETVDDLIGRAKAVSEHAYSPYGKFPVGAAVLSGGGEVFAGCNVENASFGLTICAERNAIFQMVAAGQREIVAVVIYTPTEAPVAPCGACRQVINEFGPHARVISACDGPGRLDMRLPALIPEAFGPGNLNQMRRR